MQIGRDNHLGTPLACTRLPQLSLTMAKRDNERILGAALAPASFSVQYHAESTRNLGSDPTAKNAKVQVNRYNNLIINPKDLLLSCLNL